MRKSGEICAGCGEYFFDRLWHNAEMTTIDAAKPHPQVEAALEQLFRQLAAELAQGNDRRLALLMRYAQRDLRALAHHARMQLRAGETLSTTALVHEAYLKLSASDLPAVMDRRLFFGIAARVMRQVLIDYSRAMLADKRGAGAAHMSDDEARELADPSAAQFREALQLYQAIDQFQQVHARAAEVVRLRFFTGLDDQEIGDLLGVEASTVRRDWLKARAWLQLHLTVS